MQGQGQENCQFNARTTTVSSEAYQDLLVELEKTKEALNKTNGELACERQSEHAFRKHIKAKFNALAEHI